ncbi:hypothetical protein JK635_08250 [Neobacillus sp. YIM B02564]|uniref:Uncharacterized protein n=1 Tax=Neobacillus paridis TaxID=2803862 RepID=A0ABS1TN95_9BACI|nr:hypothetical protein [Neobacillus paridis]MBL4952199.1 hypothetical protein [Neobacillus paridis]
MEMMTEKEYVQMLENLVVFLCQTYEKIHKTALEECKKNGNEFAFKMPTIQGTPNVIAINRIAKLIEHPKPTRPLTHLAYEMRKRLKEKGESS